VLVDVPKDVQQACIEWPPASATKPARHVSVPPPTAAELEAAIGLLQAAERPVLYVGGGVIQAGAERELAEFALRQQIPMVCTLMGLGCFDPEHALHCGMLGMHAAPFTNLLLRECDLLLAVGVRFDDRATGKLSEFCPTARVLHVDIDRREIGKLRRVELGVVCDVGVFLRALLPLTKTVQRPGWLARAAQLRDRHPHPAAGHAGDAPEVPALLRYLGARIALDTVVTTDVGQHQMWVAQHLAIRRPRQLLTSGGLGTMGFGLPAAIGAALATGGRVICVSGDGSLLLNIQELATLAELELDVTILLFDNRHLGLVRQQQVLFYEQRLSAAGFERPTDFVAVARAFGIQAQSWRPKRDLLPDLAGLLEAPGPKLIHVPLDAAEMVLPMVPPGAANHEMLGMGVPRVSALEPLIGTQRFRV
jgi:acetolactate synthase-1/2/3 large subunit